MPCKKGGQQYLIFVASPFVSLVKQYCNDIQEAGILEEHIYNYDNIVNSSENNLTEEVKENNFNSQNSNEYHSGNFNNLKNG